MTIAKPAILTFYAYSKYMKFFHFIVTHPKPKMWENLLDFWKRGITPQNSSDLIENPLIKYIISENLTIEVSSSNLQSVEFRCFPRCDCIKPKVQDNWAGTHSNVNLKLFFRWPYILGKGEVLFSAILGHQTTTLSQRGRIYNQFKVLWS